MSHGPRRATIPPQQAGPRGTLTRQQGVARSRHAMDEQHGAPRTRSAPQVQGSSLGNLVSSRRRTLGNRTQLGLSGVQVAGRGRSRIPWASGSEGKTAPAPMARLAGAALRQWSWRGDRRPCAIPPQPDARSSSATRASMRVRAPPAGRGPRQAGDQAHLTRADAVRVRTPAQGQRSRPARPPTASSSTGRRRARYGCQE